MSKYFVAGQPSPSTWTREECVEHIHTRLSVAVGELLGSAMTIEERAWYNLPDYSVDSLGADSKQPTVRGYVCHADPIEPFYEREIVRKINDFVFGVLPPFDGRISDDQIQSAAVAIVRGEKYDDVRRAGSLWCCT